MARAPRFLIALFTIIVLVTTALGLFFMSLTWHLPSPSTWGIRGFTALLAVTLLAIGIPVAARRPSNPIGWIYLWASTFAGLQLLLEEYGNYSLVAPPGTLPGINLAVWVTVWIWVPVVGALCAYPFLLFPDGRPPSPRWRAVGWLAAVGISLMTVCFMAFPDAESQSNLPVTRVLVIDEAIIWPMLGLSAVMLGLGSALSVAAMLVHFRRARGVERQQFKWMLSAGAFLALGIATQFVMALVVEPWIGYTSKIDDIVLILGILALPVAMGVAILRYGLWQIDLFINRALVYGSLTGLLLAVYLLNIILLQSLFRALTGQSNELAVIVSTLVIAALFQPLRGRVQAAIDRRFYRRAYDATRTLAAFSGRLRDEVDLPALAHDLTRVVDETMRPSHVSLWIRPAGDLGAASWRSADDETMRA